jgi:agmatine/peptidylarginine deiminase
MISDKATNVIYFSNKLKTNSIFSETVEQLTQLLDHIRIEYSFLPNTKDIWARDYMPIQISENNFIEYRYDPDYLQGKTKGFRNLKTYPDIVCDSMKLKTIKTDIILDGGNIVKSSNCIVLTDKIVQENKHQYNKTELIQKLHEIFEVEKVVLIPWDKKEKFGHSDGVLRFIDEKTVLVSEIYKNDKRLFEILKQNHLNTEILKVKINREHKWNWAYINFLQTKDLILLPMFNIDEDNNALEQISKYFPEYSKNDKILNIEMSEIVKLGGALNCISWTIKKDYV